MWKRTKVPLIIRLSLTTSTKRPIQFNFTHVYYVIKQITETQIIFLYLADSENITIICNYVM